MLAWAYLASGRGTQAEQSVRHAQAAAASNPDPFSQASALVGLLDSAFESDVAAVGGHVIRYTEWASKIGAPSLLAWAAYYKGREQLWVHNPPDVQGALATYREGLDRARKAGDIRNENLMLNAVVWAATSRQTAEATEACREAITRFHDTRTWLLLWPVLVAMSSWFETTGNIEPAAVIYGHLDAHHPPYSEVDGRLRGLQLVHQHPRADQLMARGAAMDRDQLVAFVLEQLVKPSSS